MTTRQDCSEEAADAIRALEIARKEAVEDRRAFLGLATQQAALTAAVGKDLADIKSWLIRTVISVLVVLLLLLAGALVQARITTPQAGSVVNAVLGNPQGTP